MLKFFRRKPAHKQKLPEPHAPNGEVKEAEHNQALALETLDTCIRHARESRKRISRSVEELVPRMAMMKK